MQPSREDRVHDASETPRTDPEGHDALDVAGSPDAIEHDIERAQGDAATSGRHAPQGQDDWDVPGTQPPNTPGLTQWDQ